jgi:RNA polymerase-binding transcription factor DksA
MGDLLTATRRKEAVMTKSKRVMRRLILSRLCDHLREQYADLYPLEMLQDGELSVHQLDAFLAFKSDPVLEELRLALERLEEGTFGICLSCKGPISQEVLDRDPTQRICSMCEQQFVAAAHHRYMEHPVAT